MIFPAGPAGQTTQYVHGPGSAQEIWGIIIWGISEYALQGLA